MKSSWENLLSIGTVTLTSSATGYDSYRLYDGRMGRMWKAGSSAEQTISLDLGSDSYDVNVLIIPSGHNLSGRTLTFEYSADGSAWTSAVSSWVGEDAEIRKILTTAVRSRYWRVVISSGAEAAQVGECWIGYLKTFTSSMAEGTVEGFTPNVQTVQSVFSPFQSSLSFGDSMRLVRGKTTPIPSAERSDYEDWIQNWNGSNPFYFYDYLGNGFFASFASEPEITDSLGYSEAFLDIQQIW